MRRVVGVFDRREAACAAVAALARSGFDRAHIEIRETHPHATAAVVAAPSPAGTGVLDRVDGVLAGLLGVERRPAGSVADEHGAAVVNVDLEDDALAPRAELALVTSGAVDITHRTLE